MIGRLRVRALSELPRADAALWGRLDRLAVEEFGITLNQMTEQAGSHLAEVVRVELGGDLRGRIVIVAVGPGDGAVGGLVAARHLSNRGARVCVVLASPAIRMALASRDELATLIAMGVGCCVATFDLSNEELAAVLESADIVVDAVAGNHPVGIASGDVERLIGFVVRSDRPVVSLDVPSGMDPDTGCVGALSITPTATVTAALPRAGVVAAAGEGRAGRVYLVDIGLPAALFARLGLVMDTPFSDGRIVVLEPGG